MRKALAINCRKASLNELLKHPPVLRWRRPGADLLLLEVSPDRLHIVVGTKLADRALGYVAGDAARLQLPPDTQPAGP